MADLDKLCCPLVGHMPVDDVIRGRRITINVEVDQIPHRSTEVHSPQIMSNLKDKRFIGTGLRVRTSGGFGLLVLNTYKVFPLYPDWKR